MRDIRARERVIRPIMIHSDEIFVDESFIQEKRNKIENVRLNLNYYIWDYESLRYTLEKSDLGDFQHKFVFPTVLNVTFPFYSVHMKSMTNKWHII